LTVKEDKVICQNLNVNRAKNFVYSEAFKRKIVSDIESGKYGVRHAMKVYGIGGKMTIYGWLSLYGREKRAGGKMVSSKGSNETEDLRDRIRCLEKIVSDLTIEKKILEATIKIASESYGVDLKKNIGKKSLEQFNQKDHKGS
jgi:transposase